MLVVSDSGFRAAQGPNSERNVSQTGGIKGPRGNWKVSSAVKDVRLMGKEEKTPQSRFVPYFQLFDPGGWEQSVAEVHFGDRC